MPPDGSSRIFSNLVSASMPAPWYPSYGSRSTSPSCTPAERLIPRAVTERAPIVMP